MGRHGALRRECRGGQLQRSLLWSLAATLVALAILASVVTQAAPTEVEDSAPWQPTDTRGSEANCVMAHAPTVHGDGPHAPLSGDALTPADGLSRHDDSAASMSPESPLSPQKHYGQATGHAGELHTDTVSTGGAVESDTAVASTPPSPPPSETLAGGSVAAERNWPDAPLQQDAPRQSLSHGAQYSNQEGDWDHKQHQVTVDSVTASSPKRADDTDATCAGDAYGAAPAKEPATASSNSVGRAAAAADAAQGWVTSPAALQKDIAASLQTNMLPAFDEATVSPTAREEGNSPPSAKPRAEALQQQLFAREEAPAVTEKAPAVTEKAPAVTEEAPAVTEEAPAVTEKAPAVTEEASAVTEEASAVTEEASAVTEEAPAVTEEASAVSVEAPAVTEKAPAVTEEAPAVTEKAPAVTEEASAVTEKAPAVTEKASAVTEKAPAVTEKAPAVTEKAPAVTEKVSAVTEEASAVTEKAPAVTEKVSAVTEKAPAVTEKAPAVTEKVSAVTEKAPAVTEEASAVTEEASAVTEKAPAVTEKAPAVTEEASAVTEKAPAVTEKAPAVTEKVSAVTEEAPAVTEKASAVTEEAPAVTEKAPAVTEEAPAVTEKAPAVTEEASAVTEEAPAVTEEAPAVTEEAFAKVEEKPNENVAADVALTEAAKGAAGEAQLDPGKVGDVRLDKERDTGSSSPPSPTITAHRGRTNARYHPYEQHRLRSRSSTPSRVALSYLYYHALEALYVDENITLFVQRARDMVPYGHARLNWLLGVLHAYGVGVPRSERDALMYYSFAAMEAVPEAHMALGYRYKLGLGVVESCESALMHYREAADAVAMTYDGTTAASSDGVTAMTTGAKTIGSGKGGRSGSTSFFAYRDDAAASDMRHQRRLDIMSLKYQADIGNVNALLTLGYLLLKGDYQVVRDGRRAAAYFEAAAEKGSAQAQGALGQLYMAGDPSISPPLLPDLRRALHYFRLGAQQNDALSLNGIGFLHAIGYLYQDKRQGATGAFNTTGAPGISDDAAAPASNGSPDFVTAAQYFYRSHCAEGLYNLGVLFLHGRGVVLDKKHARRLFEKAARQGSVLAQWQLANMLSEPSDDGSGIRAAECERALALYQRTASFGTWQYRASGKLRTGGGTGVGARHADTQSQPQRRNEAEGNMGTGLDGNARPLERTGPRDVPSHDGSRDGGDSHRADGDDAANRLDGFVRPRSEAEYRVLLAGILDRLHAVEESLVLSDEGEGPTTVSLASFVELLSLAEAGDAAAPWLAAQYVDDYLEVADTTQRGGRRAGESGAVPLLWPSTESVGTSEYLSGEAAASELLYHLLQRTVLHHTQTHTTLGAAYLRLGNFYYYGESPLYGVDMERALTYYRIAGDHHHNAQALFNVGFMYQLGLHRAPRATRVVGSMSAQEVSERANVLRHYTSSPVGAEWKVHSNPPEYLRGSPAFRLAVKAAANAWNRASADPMARGVDVYLAWKYYIASLEHEERGSMAVRFALAVLNLQWSLRHFGAAGMLSKVAAFASPSTAPPASADSASFMTEAGGDDVDVPVSAGAGGSRSAQQNRYDAVQGLLRSLTTMLHFVCDDLVKGTVYVAKAMRSWYTPFEDAVLYGAISVAVVGLLIRHHVA
ncbi:hypothetical protein LSCM4_06317 [Leishmania orientalis]|uniref:Sel1 repeat family protein n=1 Tax=Leishmania orientalis TaxID=2249476 RepID=A0A836HYT3_9TRYP|nr:hypothetical protein LSCM4_06317 [Leishmania orientalis]